MTAGPVRCSAWLAVIGLGFGCLLPFTSAPFALGATDDVILNVAQFSVERNRCLAAVIALETDSRTVAIVGLANVARLKLHVAVWAIRNRGVVATTEAANPTPDQAVLPA